LPSTCQEVVVVKPRLNLPSWPPGRPGLAGRAGALWAAPLALVACTGAEPKPEGPSGKLEIVTAPLQLDEITDAEYRLTVTNALSKTVFTQEISSRQYGDGHGSATYVGPCDASPEAQPNTVKLDLLALYAGEDGDELVPTGSYVNPTPVSVAVVCEENADVRVDLNITLMRSAQQGFFDFAINFDDIFCSAKVDCQEELLHNPLTGKRDDTVVVALACTAGVGQDTTMYWGDAAIVCREGERVTATYPIDFAQPGGQHGPVFANAQQEKPGVFETAVYLTDEQFEAQGIDKCSWNMAIGINLEELGKDCTFEAYATAAGAEFTEPEFHTPPNTTYPVIRYKVPLTNKTGQLICGANPLDGEASGVTTKYTPLAGVPLSAKAGCGEDPESAGITCSGTAQGKPGLVYSLDASGKVVVTYNGQTFGPFALPPQTQLAQECCADPCCEEAP